MNRKGRLAIVQGNWEVLGETGQRPERSAQVEDDVRCHTVRDLQQ